MPHRHFALPIFSLLLMGATSSFEDTTLLDRQVASHLNAGIGEAGGALAPIDDRLKLKRCPASVELSGTKRNASLLSCPGLGWRIFVPVSRNGRQDSGRDDRAGAILIQRNQPVTLIVRRSNFSIRYGVIAQKSGRMGEYIPVRSDRKSKELMARVSGSGEVELAR